MAEVAVSRSWAQGMSSDNIKGLVLALSSSFFIGASFIVKKKGLKKAGASGVRAGVGGYSYLYEPLWWAGMITMIVGEIANFAAYAFAPAILVTPLGALSIIISAVLAYIILREKLHIFGILGCVLCVVGSTTIVLHAPQERGIESVKEVWDLATEPAFLFYAALVIAAVFILIVHFIPLYGQTHIMVYIGVCSLVGSLSVMSVKALGIALKLTFSGMNQLIYPQTWAFTIVVITCVITQMNYLNKALDTFNTAVVSPIYYAMFTSLTILASVIMFKESWSQTLVVVLKKESENKSYTEFEDVSKKRLRPRLEMNVGSLRVGSSPCLNREKTFACSLPIECWLLRSSIGHMAICIQKDLNLILIFRKTET
ncbi:probable magnesium transporter NIPA4 isoform X1 [Vitis vinifera]|uniref:probable magnesium transporter NIPA4 isoform X1 n=1 Tax=Vitis vinifera TaxID=29760 RepID=UPI000540110D|nr:probable magnesium transporter NIPA4 isoform X1 [Vitis vinifera]XP_010665107.1 probable magnesium transporter NIPA4 isoform X1 [Vitis vinifera]XP_010665108.1 probable magnesium transporter NIPA4 isoform X1 [Vitis vinifera]XP_010665109.1 probable magnesium transporter NIPA4 isoform X1 [Vitis vinifera]|eukprot:XP_010665106.1 PREDICTED: probable magnesium transporter NIPA4 isoform X1 [Vitis vinifera]